MTTITSYEIQNTNGDKVTIANFGARITKWLTPVGNQVRNIVLGYDKLEDFLSDASHMGAIAGPYANRIANAECNIDNKSIKLVANEGSNQLHGGENALGNQFWLCTDQTTSSITLFCKLTDGYNGYPGELSVEVNYTISTESMLTITMTVNTTKTTIAGPTAHPYFNLNVQQNSAEHSLKVNSEYYTPVNDKCIPTGEITPVKNSNYDFTSLKSFASDDSTKRLDNNFLISHTDTSTDKTLFNHATLVSEDKKLTLHARSNYPAIQVYTAQHLQAPFFPNQGICLEPQFCPDSPNQQTFPFHLTTPNEPLKTVIVYQLEK
jgi:aldose 1-epimerase